ncbi:hypothetical protein DICPUDRAFT_157215 [Dictyostelium purpureum]|uniref:Swiss Army Knife RNA repair protein HAD domain-containing protein n=1 Tax=Dictyostelium purpureum TaxID=5786 RepID=F0ZYK5_DICPU|nr:uncharacterized protein DICPUDRAFT_157215 [Dictyostelium purpureum]EGC30975.1 hypothetical protein DICPUDRAFT_157215 [Dictyostelium purpureum]|eukprot:XP_003292502.1 hypothetical protein DICPUDRAFT_157215 [Dictyostelium purpureum]
MKSLYIFDFDGTIFKSPEPNPALWTSQVIGKIKSMPSENNGFGWFQDTITLDEPYVPASPSEDWFNMNVLNDALNSYKDQNNVVCLLTGRTTLYSNIIDRILKSANLNFHHKGLKPINIPNVQRESTFDFKKRFILNLINSVYSNQIKEVIVYEDRIGHVELFENFLSTLKSITYKVIHINESPKYLLESDELKLVEYLVKKNTQDLSNVTLKKHVDYTGLVLNKESVSKLVSLFDLPSDWTIKAHHVTLNLGSYNPKSWRNMEEDNELLAVLTKINLNTTTTIETAESQTTLNDVSSSTHSVSVTSTTTTTSTTFESNDYSITHPIGSTWEFNIEAIGFSENALAVKVQGIPSSNVIPHCTIAIHPFAKAADSNSIRNWYPISHFKPGEKTKLKSHNETDLKQYYQNLVNKQDNSANTSPSKGKPKTSNKPNSPSECSVLIPVDFKDSLTLSGTITEVGKLFYDIPKPVKQAKVDPYSLIRAANPELSKDEIIRIIPKVKAWLSNNPKETNTKDIINHLKNNINDLK